MNTTNKALLVLGLVLGGGQLGCSNEVLVADADALEAADCPSCAGTARVELSGLDWLAAGDPDLDIDMCVGVSCGQALVGVSPLPEGSYPDRCIADGDEVACCSTSPVETMPDCSAAPQESVFITMTLPRGARPGDTLSVFADVSTMLGDYVVGLDGQLTVLSCGEGCVTGATALE